MLRCSQSPNCVIARSRYEGLPFLPTMTTYARRLGLFSGTMAVVGGIIGGGIFRTPAVVAERVGSAGLALRARLLGGERERSEEHTAEIPSQAKILCPLLPVKKKQ